MALQYDSSSLEEDDITDDADDINKMVEVGDEKKGLYDIAEDKLSDIAEDEKDEIV